MYTLVYEKQDSLGLKSWESFAREVGVLIRTVSDIASKESGIFLEFRKASPLAGTRRSEEHPQQLPTVGVSRPVRRLRHRFVLSARETAISKLFATHRKLGLDFHHFQTDSSID